MTYRERLKTQTVKQHGWETTGRTYVDRSALPFGEDAKERLLDDTEGLGAIQRDKRGSAYVFDRRDKSYRPVSDKEIDSVYLGGRKERDFNPETDV